MKTDNFYETNDALNLILLIAYGIIYNRLKRKYVAIFRVEKPEVIFLMSAQRTVYNKFPCNG